MRSLIILILLLLPAVTHAVPVIYTIDYPAFFLGPDGAASGPGISGSFQFDPSTGVIGPVNLTTPPGAGWNTLVNTNLPGFTYTQATHHPTVESDPGIPGTPQCVENPIGAGCLKIFGQELSDVTFTGPSSSREIRMSVAHLFDVPNTLLIFQAVEAGGPSFPDRLICCIDGIYGFTLAPEPNTAVLVFVGAFIILLRMYTIRNRHRHL